MYNLKSALELYRATPEQIRAKALRRKEAVILEGEAFRLQAAYMTLPPIGFERRAAA